MSVQDDRDFQQWTKEWQAGTPREVTSADQIRHYVKRRSSLLWSFVVIDLVIGAIALPVLAYYSVAARNEVERFTMLGLISITLATIGFGWWNWRGVLRASAANTAEYLAISAERLRRMRLAWRAGWLVLSAQDAVFTVWIWEQLYSGRLPYNAGAERFAWSMLGGMTIAAVIGLVIYGRWIRRDTKRFEALRREFDKD
jgi:hypothetical protein